MLPGDRVAAEDHLVVYCAGQKTKLKTQCPSPRIVEIPLPIANGEQAVHVKPVFERPRRREATRKAIVVALRALEQDVSEGPMSVAHAAWAGKTFAQFFDAARRL